MSPKRPLARVLALGLACAGPAHAASPAEAPPLWEKLRARLAEVDRRLDGELGLSVVDLESGAVCEIRGDEVFPAASTIKLAVLYELYRQAAEGRIDLHEVTRPPLPRVAGSGVLQALGGDVRLTWRDLAVLMIGWSDNEAANRVIDRLGRAAVERRLAELALPGLHLRRRMMDLEAARRGDENTATPRDLRRLAEIVWTGPGLSGPLATDLRAVAGVAEGGSDFRAGLGEGVRAAAKSGSLEGVRCEVAYVDLPGRPYAAAILTRYLRRDEDGAAAIREVSTLLYETFDRLARASPFGRVFLRP